MRELRGREFWCLSVILENHPPATGAVVLDDGAELGEGAQCALAGDGEREELQGLLGGRQVGVAEAQGLCRARWVVGSRCPVIRRAAWWAFSTPA